MENTAAYWQLKILHKSIRESIRFQRIRQLVGTATGNMRCLVAGGNPALHYQIHHLIGNWTSLAYSQQECDALKRMVGDNVLLLNPHTLPDGEFDRIIIIDLLEKVDDDRAFVAACHRALRDSGLLLLNVAHQKKWSGLSLLRKLLDVAPDAAQVRRTGYTNSGLFDILKDGFDVEETTTFSRFYSETMHLLVAFAGSFVVSEPPPIDNEETRLAAYYHRIYRYYAFMYPLTWLVTRLDLLIFMTKGYLLLSRAKKRMWRPRKSPKLRDGRSIAEATLGGKIGTAAEF
jgi:SAM-dependent methyltransferase